MSGDEPIELPSLRGPSAAVCAGGHLIAWFIEPSAVGRFCKKCGAPVLVACSSCGAALPGDPEMLEWVPYHGNCPECGNAYPWKADDIARVKRTLAEQAEVEAWSNTAKARADEVVDEIAGDRATPSSVLAAMNWLAMSGAETARTTIVDAVDRLGSTELKQSLRSNFPGQL